MQASDINREWHQSHPHSFGGKYRSYWKYNNLSKEVIDKEFFKNDILFKVQTSEKSKVQQPCVCLQV